MQCSRLWCIAEPDGLQITPPTSPELRQALKVRVTVDDISLRDLQASPHPGIHA